MNMKRRNDLAKWLVGVAITTVTVLVLAKLFTRKAIHGAQPGAAIVENIEYQFPPALPGRVVTHAFVIRNQWDGVLRFTKFQPTCICTRGELGKTVLYPGQATRLRLSVNPSPYQVGQELGAILRGQINGRLVAWCYSLSVRAAYPLHIPRNAIPLRLGVVDMGQQPIALRPLAISRRILPMQWNHLTCRSDDRGSQAKLRRVGEGHWFLYVSYKPVKFLGQIVSHIIFTFWNNDTAQNYQMSLPVEVDARGPLCLSTYAVLLGPVRSGAQTTSRISILPANAAEKLPIKVLGVIYSNPRGFSDRVTGTPERPVVTTFYTAGKSSGDATGQMTISVGYAGRNYALRVAYLAVVPQSKIGADEK